MAAGALSGAEWLQAARVVLGAASDQDLRLVDVLPDGEPLGLFGESLCVAVRVRRGANGEDLRAGLFLKTVPSENALREQLCADSRAFHKEAAFYALLARLLPRLRNGVLQPWGPRCLLSKPPRLLLFEDLTAQGYKMLGARFSLDFAHCAAALDALARLHAASLALEQADRRARNLNPWRLGDRFPDPLQEVMFTDEFPNPLNDYFLSGLKTVRAVIDRMHEFRDSPRYADIVRKLDELPQLAYNLVKASDKHRNVICHGEPIVTNILFRYSSWGQVEAARLVDLQQTRYAPPALDVAALLHCCARRELRETRGAELRDLYHTALTRALADAGFPATTEALVPRGAFDASWADCASFGPVAACTLPAAWLPGDVLRAQRDDPEALRRFLAEDRSEIVVAEFERDADYRERVGEVVAELVHKVLLRK